jgi:tRNA 2-thiouridine synthesizing protein A
MEANTTLDCKGLNCPMPVLKAKKAMEGLKTGEILKVVTTDKGSMNDMPAFAKRTGNEVLEIKEEDNTFVFFLKKS